MLHDPVHDTIVRIDAFVITFQPLPPLVSCDPQRNTVLRPKFLKLGHNAVGDDRYALGVEAVHHGR